MGTMRWYELDWLNQVRIRNFLRVSECLLFSVSRFCCQENEAGSATHQLGKSSLPEDRLALLTRWFRTQDLATEGD